MIKYSNSKKVSASAYSELLNSSTLGLRRPVDDIKRMQKIIDNSNIFWTAWDGNKLVGVARGVSDFAFDCYLNDLAVSKEYQKQGIGNQLIKNVKEQIGNEVQLLLLAAPAAINYYPKIGFKKIDNAFVIPRQNF